MAKASLVWRGRVFKYGDNLSTDHMLPSRFMSQVEPHELAANCLAGVDPDFAKKVRQATSWWLASTPATAPAGNRRPRP